jgi:hypothetical protein
MRSHIASTEEGVFRDVIDRSVEDLHETIDSWQDQAADKVYKYFGNVEKTFHTSYLYEDKEESQAKLDAKQNLQKAIRAAKEALPALTREIEKCGA